MKLSPIPFDEIQRLSALQNMSILDSKPEERFDRLTRLAQHIFCTPCAFISLVDKDRVWFKAKVGCDVHEEPRDLSICGHTICNSVTGNLSTRLFEVSDTHEDDRFKDNKFVVQECGVRYYMGFVLQSIDHRNVGTLCVIDTRPRVFTDSEKKTFIDLGMMVEKEIHQKAIPDNYGDDVNDAESADKFLKLAYKLRIIQNQLDSNLRKAGINFKEWCMLNAIMELEYATPHLLSKNLYISPQLTTKRLEKLEVKNLIQRWNSKDGDRRFVHITCSNRGIKLWREGIIEAQKLEMVHLKDIVYLN